MTNAGEMKGYLRLQNRQQSRNLNRHFILSKDCGIIMFMIRKLSETSIRKYLQMKIVLHSSCVTKLEIIAVFAMEASF